MGHVLPGGTLPVVRAESASRRKSASWLLCVAALCCLVSCGSDSPTESVSGLSSATTTSARSSTLPPSTTTTTTIDECTCGEKEPIPTRSDVAAEIRVAERVRSRLIDAGIGCRNQPRPADPNADAFDIKVSVVLGCTVDGTAIDLGVFRSTGAARSAVETLRGVNCAMSRQPTYVYVDGGTWILTASSPKTTFASESRTKPIADALHEKVVRYECP